MDRTVEADASPEKRLFISLLTRDISLAAAFLDLIDNSINAAVEPFAGRLKTASDYLGVAADPDIAPTVRIKVDFGEKGVSISDNAGGIPFKTAIEHVFKFGRGEHEKTDGNTDRLSVYGIGLKRAMFKLGNKIEMTSDHREGGFALDLDVRAWEKKNKQPWTFPVSPRDKAQPGATGTSIKIKQLADDVSARLTDGVFEGQLREAIARTYAYFLAKFVTIEVNGSPVDGISFDIGENRSAESFDFNDATCSVMAGLGVPQAGGYRDRSSGWFVFCNGRAVVSADKSMLTGWGSSLPIFQPKHRPFVGTVYFVSENPEQLPWTTTKSAINEDSAIWQTAKRHMASVGRAVITFLDSRYTDSGTDIPSKELQEAAGNNRINVLAAAAMPARTFAAPKRPKPTTTRIQYDARISDIKVIAEYLGNPSMSGSDVGRHTFTYFLENEATVD